MSYSRVIAFRPLLLFLAGIISACGGGGNGDNSGSMACTLLTGGDTSVAFTPTPTCVNCEAENLPAAIDGSLATGAGVSVPSGIAGTAGVTGTAQIGITFPGGNVAGAVVSFPTGQGNTFGLTTYLDGVRQETLLTAGNGTNPIYVTGDTHLPFDAVEITLDRTTPVGDARFDVFGLCSQVDRAALQN